MSKFLTSHTINKRSFNKRTKMGSNKKIENYYFTDNKRYTKFRKRLFIFK